jgi:hypothetical protein
MTSSKLRPGAYVQVTHSPRDTGEVLPESDPRVRALRIGLEHIALPDKTTPVLCDARCKSWTGGEVILVRDRDLEPQLVIEPPYPQEPQRQPERQRRAEREGREPEAGG